MDRDEILRRSRGRRDEGDIFAENRGRRFGVVFSAYLPCAGVRPHHRSGFA